MMSLGLLLDGVLAHVQFGKPCYQYKLIYGLFIVAIVTGFLSVLGLAIERFQVDIDSSQPDMSRRIPTLGVLPVPRPPPSYAQVQHSVVPDVLDPGHLFRHNAHIANQSSGNQRRELSKDH